MLEVNEHQEQADLIDPKNFFNRELSWLEFNRRVLQEAQDHRNPLIERLKFSGIFSSNLDEFFMVRVSGLMEQVQAQVMQQTLDRRTPEQQLEEISQLLHPLVEFQHRYFEQELRPLMAKAGIHLIGYPELTPGQQGQLRQYFEQRIFPVLTPLTVDPAHPFPRMSNLSLNLAVVVHDPRSGNERFARVKVPNILPRFIPLEQIDPEFKPPASEVWTALPLEAIIAHNLELLFPGMEVQECYLFRITRDADFEVLDDEADDLLLAIQEEIRKRRFGGFVVRLEVEATMSEPVLQRLQQEMGLTEREVYRVEGLLNHKDLMSLLALPLPELKDAPWTPVIPERLQPLQTALTQEDGSGPQLDFFSVIQQGDLLVHHPYESFTASVETFITQAASDPDVLAIKMTLYRTSSDSPIIQALLTAAENAKQVAVLVELKARFDEESNINWARMLEEAGIHVAYGVVGLKTHTKTLLVVRQEGEHIRRYVHIGTGNYNSKTAKLYTDLGLFSCREDLGADLTDLFNFLTGCCYQESFRKLLVAPMTLRQRMLALIQREQAHCQQGRPGRMIARMNSLVDTEMIEALYAASQTGVQIDLIVRGICCLRPGVPGLSENIRAISIIGRFLEHSRIFYFLNDGQEELFIGSADWMSRNLDRRVEAVTPIEDPDLAQQLKAMLDLMLADNRQAWDLQSDGTYVQRVPREGEPERATQTLLMQAALAQ